jgi:S-layer homology domain
MVGSRGRRLAATCVALVIAFAGHAPTSAAREASVDRSRPAPQAAESCSGRALSDRADDTGGYQVHAMYVVASDGPDAALDTNGSIARSMDAFNAWLAGQTGGAALRLDRCGGTIDVTFVRLARTDAAISAEGAYARDVIEEDLHALGLIAPTKIYAVYYGGSSTYSCGGAAWPPELPGHVAALYLGGLEGSCSSMGFVPGGAPGYLEFAMLHDIVHTLGVVARCAPNHTLNGHVGDSAADLMYSGSAPWALPPALDVGGDDYWATGRADCPDLSKSIFLEPAAPDASPPPGWPPPPPPPSFSDIGASPFAAEIAWIAERGITNGCGGGRYCPLAAVTRGQMASFIARALALPPAAQDYFVDDADSFHEADINRLRQANITLGCGHDAAGQPVFCPADAVTRAQMASFLARALGLPPAASDHFADDAASYHEGDINRLFEAGVTRGCGDGLYCPGTAVTREQMAAFLYRAFAE